MDHLLCETVIEYDSNDVMVRYRKGCVQRAECWSVAIGPGSQVCTRDNANYRHCHECALGKPRGGKIFNCYTISYLAKSLPLNNVVIENDSSICHIFYALALLAKGLLIFYHFGRVGS